MSNMNRIERKTLIRIARTLCLAGLLGAMGASERAAGERLTLSFNPDWKFLQADPDGAQRPDFDDRAWATVSAPHTYNDVDTFDNWSVTGHRGEQNQWGGRTWYRKTFTAPDSWKGKKVYLEFEAARQVAEVYFNDHLLGTHKSGFSPFGFDLTELLQFDKPNVLAVMVDNRFQKDPLDGAQMGVGEDTANPTGVRDRGASAGRETGGLARLTENFNRQIPDSLAELEATQIPWNNPHWHPAHGGLYRNVKLHVVDPLHITLPLYSFLKTTGPYVYATEISYQSAQLCVEVPIENGRDTAQDVEVVVRVLERDGKPVLTMRDNTKLAAGEPGSVKICGSVENPKLWEPSDPYLYRVVVSLNAKNEPIDTVEIAFGIRTARWDTNDGFFINGHHLKLHGWGQKPTDEWPGIGSAQPDWMHDFTLRLMREAGGNFVRWGHTASGPAQIRSADQLGIITDQPGVDGEGDTRGGAWKLRSNTFRDVIIYFRNHPSILAWEGGNQKVSRKHAAELRGHMDTYDPHGGRVYTHRRPDRVVAEFMDVEIGTEGDSDLGMSTMPTFEGEYDREESPRRVWDAATPRRVGGDDSTPIVFGYVEAQGSYRLTSEEFAVNQILQYVDKLLPAYHSGGANWVFSDSTSGGRVTSEVCRASGEVDAVRLPKEAYWVCRAMFRDEPIVHIVGHWNYPADTKKTIHVASNCDEVELIVNDTSLGRVGPTDKDGKCLKYLFTFPDVSCTPGWIKAVGYRNGQVATEQVKKTAGDTLALKLTPITGPAGLLADGSDYVLIDVEAVDENGQRCPTFERRVDFEVQGPGIWRGGYNSGITDSINRTDLNLECGINRVAIRAKRTAGVISVTARCEGLTSGQANITSLPIEVEHGSTLADRDWADPGRTGVERP
jgi:beta-galactosidase